MTSVVVGLVALALPATAFAQSVRIEPPAAEPGAQVTAEGFEFLPGEPVTLSFAGAQQASGTADEEGFVRLVWTVPEGIEPGEHPLQVTGTESGSQVDLMYEVLTAEEPPPATTATVESEDPAEAGGATTPVAQPEEAAEEEGGGFPWWAIALIALAVLGGGVLLLATRARRPQGEQCPEVRRVRVEDGISSSLLDVIGGEREVEGGPCTWYAVWMDTKLYHYDFYRCRLGAKHRGRHAFKEDPDRREPADESFADEPVMRTELIREDPTCTMQADEVSARFQAPCPICQEPRGDAQPCPHCGIHSDPKEMTTEKLIERNDPNVPCKICGEPRGLVTPCPHCGMD